MARPKIRGDIKALNINIDAHIADELTRISNETGISKTKIVEKALRNYFDNNQKNLNSLK